MNQIKILVLMVFLTALVSCDDVSNPLGQEELCSENDAALVNIWKKHVDESIRLECEVDADCSTGAWLDFDNPREGNCGRLRGKKYREQTQLYFNDSERQSILNNKDYQQSCPRSIPACADIAYAAVCKNKVCEYVK